MHLPNSPVEESPLLVDLCQILVIFQSRRVIILGEFLIFSLV